MCRIMKCQSIHLASNQSSIILQHHFVAEASQRAGRVPLTMSKVPTLESTKRKKGVLSFGAFLAYSYLWLRRKYFRSKAQNEKRCSFVWCFPRLFVPLQTKRWLRCFCAASRTPESSKAAPVVQWIEWKIPVLQIRVRFPTGVPRMARWIHSLFKIHFTGNHPHIVRSE